MAQNREYNFLQPGTVVRHARYPDRWGVIRSVSPDRKYGTVVWRGGGVRTHSLSDLIRAAAPCAECGERADAHRPGVDHAFIKENN